MDRFKDMAGAFNPGDIKKYTQGVSWPIGKDDLVNVMKQNGAPDGVTSKVQDADADQFSDQNDVMSKLGG
ncbi:MAG: DUF2795 domain-containing protein [Chloroflexia bacterium]|jgi:hypothetical protein|nr:DUF2795 domain-containing protein [Chloroflexia bacterium]MDQ3443821.1 DUF2795 domain-containing protein [Chloroflexota bacterium]